MRVIKQRNNDTIFIKYLNSSYHIVAINPNLMVYMIYKTPNGSYAWIAVSTGTCIISLEYNGLSYGSVINAVESIMDDGVTEVYAFKGFLEMVTFLSNHIALQQKQ